jgi:tetratricopeptide (TPR) repeat protein/TolB-like protein
MPRKSFWSRVRKGRLVQVLAVYLGAAWVILQVSYVLQDAAGLPGWVPPLALLLLLIGLVVVLATAWVQSHPLTAERADRDEVPGSWELGLNELKAAVREARVPHLTWARAVLGGAIAFSLAFGVAGLYVVIQDRGRTFAPPAAYAEAAAPGLAVVPFTVTGRDLELLREGMVDLLATNLDGLGGFRAIASRTVMARWREAVGDDGTPDLPTVLEIARRTAARYAVVGGAVAAGQRLRLSATAYDLATGQDLGHAVAEGRPEDVLDLVDELSVQIVRTLLEGGAGQVHASRRSASLLTSSVPALRAFLEGEARFRRSDFPGAIAALERAVAADSTFALALYRLAEAHGWEEGWASGTDYAVQALRFVDRLSPRDALLLRVYAALQEFSPAGIDLAREAVRRYPDDPDSWYLLGDLYYHLGDHVLAGPDEATHALERAVALDPGFAPYYIHLLDRSIDRADTMRAGQYLETFSRLAPETRTLQRYRLWSDLVLGDGPARAAALAALDTVSPQLLLAPALGEPPSLRAAEALARVRHRREGDRLPLAWALQSRGKYREWAELTADSVDLPVHAFNAVLLAQPEVAGPALAYLTPDSLRPRAGRNVAAGVWAAHRADWAALDAARAAVRHTARGLLEAGDTAAARQHEVATRFLDAHARLRTGGVPATVQALREIRREGTDLEALPLDQWARWSLGHLLADSPTPADAVPYLRSLSWWSPAYYRLGEVYERTGQLDSARVAYGQFLLAWEEADQDLPLLNQAREALARLTGEAF